MVSALLLHFPTHPAPPSTSAACSMSSAAGASDRRTACTTAPPPATARRAARRTARTTRRLSAEPVAPPPVQAPKVSCSGSTTVRSRSLRAVWVRFDMQDDVPRALQGVLDEEEHVRTTVVQPAVAAAVCQSRSGVCRTLGLSMRRAAAVNDHPAFIDMLARRGGAPTPYALCPAVPMRQGPVRSACRKRRPGPGR